MFHTVLRRFKDRQFISAYSKRECERLSPIKAQIPFSVEMTSIDDRLKFYESKEKKTRTPCFAPLNEIVVAREACISLCCLDWKRDYNFGNLREQTFEEVLRSGQLQAVYERLSKGDRFLPLCKRCGWTR